MTDMYGMFAGTPGKVGGKAFNNGETGNTGANPLNWADTSKVTNMGYMSVLTSLARLSRPEAAALTRATRFARLPGSTAPLPSTRTSAAGPRAR